MLLLLLLPRYLGFLFKWESIEEPRLGHLLNSHLLSKYLAFLRARGCRNQALAVIMNAASRVCEWMHSTCQLTPLDVMHQDELKMWLATMLKGVNSLPALHKTASSHPDELLQQAHNIVSPQHLMALMHAALDKGLALIPLIEQKKLSACVEASEIGACLLVGGCQLPPIRLSVVLSLVRPDYAGELLGQLCSVTSKCWSAVLMHCRCGVDRSNTATTAIGSTICAHIDTWAEAKHHSWAAAPKHRLSCRHYCCAPATISIACSV